MRTEPETTRIVRSWLKEGRTALPDHILDAVLLELPATRQRRPVWPSRRIEHMNGYAKLATAAAAVVVVAIVGYNLLPGSTGVGVAPSPSPSPLASPSASPSSVSAPSLRPEPTRVAGAFPDTGLLDPGTYTLSQNGIRFSVEIPTSGWTSAGIEVAPDGGHMLKSVRETANAIWMIFWSIDGVFADPCGQVPGPVVSPSADDLATAVASLPGTELVAGPADVTVGGRPAKHVAITIPETIDCAPNEFFLWYDDVRCGPDDPCHRWATSIGEVNRVWIIEVDGKHIWIEAETYAGAAPEVEEEVQAIVDSIRFE